MVLYGTLYGRVGRCRISLKESEQTARTFSYAFAPDRRLSLSAALTRSAGMIFLRAARLAVFHAPAAILLRRLREARLTLPAAKCSRTPAAQPFAARSCGLFRARPYRSALLRSRGFSRKRRRCAVKSTESLFTYTVCA